MERQQKLVSNHLLPYSQLVYAVHLIQLGIEFRPTVEDGRFLIWSLPSSCKELHSLGAVNFTTFMNCVFLQDS